MPDRDVFYVAFPVRSIRRRNAGEGAAGLSNRF
jgi:hypothetical protein